MLSWWATDIPVQRRKKSFGTPERFMFLSFSLERRVHGHGKGSILGRQGPRSRREASHTGTEHARQQCSKRCRICENHPLCRPNHRRRNVPIKESKPLRERQRPWEMSCYFEMKSQKHSEPKRKGWPRPATSTTRWAQNRGRSTSLEPEWWLLREAMSGLVNTCLDPHGTAQA